MKLQEFLEAFTRKIRSLKNNPSAPPRWEQTLDLLYLACSSNASERLIRLDRAADGERLFCFITNIKGGKSHHFVSKVEPNARAKGLRVGDCILKVNDVSVACVSRDAARKRLIAKNEIRLLVKNDLRGFDRALREHSSEPSTALRSLNGSDHAAPG